MRGKPPRTFCRRSPALGKLRLMGLILTGVFVAMLCTGGVVLGQASDPVFVGAADIGNCNGNGDEATSSLVKGINGTVFTIGDNAYPNGTAKNFAKCYDPTWGQFKARTKPGVGNHDYDTPGATPYFDYFGDVAGDRAEGYYSFDRGGWHIISLNSNCSKISGGCGVGSAQEEWLKDDLDAHPNTCTIAYFHHPRFSSGVNGDNASVGPFWSDLYKAGADVVLNGHDHDYEMFSPQDPSGNADPDRGIREFVVGTGGAAFTAFRNIKPNSKARIDGTNGVIEFTLHPDGYDWQFMTAPDGKVADSGSDQCHSTSSPSPTDSRAPTVQPPQPKFAANTTLGRKAVPAKISWSATDKRSGVTGYELEKSTDGGAFANVKVPSATSTAKTLKLLPGVTHRFRVRATDGAGNTSGWAKGRALRAKVHQEGSNSTLDYAGRWPRRSPSSAYGGGVKYAGTRGNTAQFTFKGRSVAWVSTLGSDRGKAKVAIDGVRVKTVDLYASGKQAKEVVFSRSDLDPAVSHTLTVQVTGRKRPASTGQRVDIDAFVVSR
jgi:Calcineurin-like phosphoesterase